MELDREISVIILKDHNLTIGLESKMLVVLLVESINLSQLGINLRKKRKMQGKG